VLEVYNFYKIAKISFVKHKKGDIAGDFGFSLVFKCKPQLYAVKSTFFSSSFAENFNFLISILEILNVEGIMSS